MTPAIQKLDKLGVSYHIHTYSHDPACTQYGLEVVAALQLDHVNRYEYDKKHPVYQASEWRESSYSIRN